ncbi:hypothetical protein GN956_G9799 [Arapaima gigas]
MRPGPDGSASVPVARAGGGTRMKRKQLPSKQQAAVKGKRPVVRGVNQVSTKKTERLRSVKARQRHPGTGRERRGAARAVHSTRKSENGLVKRGGTPNGSGEGSSLQLVCTAETAGLSATHQEDDLGKGDQEPEKGWDSVLGDNSMLLDEDSNQIMPVGHIFGNLDLVQDYPARTPVKAEVNRREYRKLHFIAKEDSDDDDDDDQDDGPLGLGQQEGVQQCTKNRKNGLF